MTGQVAAPRGHAAPSVNRLLALLPRADYERLRPHLEYTALKYRQSLYRAYRPIGFVYFIETGVGSLVNTMANGDAAEVGTIGNEGVVGLPLILQDERSSTSVYIQVPGAGLRMKASLFQKELARSASMRTVMLHYTHAFFNQVAQSAACNQFHSLERRCRRHGSGRCAAAGRAHRLQPRQRHDPQSPRPGASRLRMLWDRQARVRSPVGQQNRAPAGDAVAVECPIGWQG